MLAPGSFVRAPLAGLLACLAFCSSGCDSTSAGPPAKPAAQVSVPKLADFRSDLTGEELWREIEFLKSRPPAGLSQEETRSLRRQHYALIVGLAERVKDSDAPAPLKAQAGVARLEALGQQALANAALVESALPEVQAERDAFFAEAARVMESDPKSPEAAAAARLRVVVAGQMVRDAGPSQAEWVKKFAEFACEQAARAYPGGLRDAQRDLASAASMAESANLPETAGKCFEAWAKAWPDDPESSLVPATIQRLNMLGKPLTLKGPLYPKGEFDLASLRGKWVIVHLWRSAGNGPEILGRLESLLPQLRARGCEVVGICLDADDKTLAPLIANGRIRSTQLFEPYTGEPGRHPLAAQFGIAPAPFSMLIDREGKVADNNFRPAKMQLWIEQLLRGQK